MSTEAWLSLGFLLKKSTPQTLVLLPPGGNGKEHAPYGHNRLDEAGEKEGRWTFQKRERLNGSLTPFVF